jgi:asparagine synthase (glutamine-hydrolysing)
LFAPEVRRAAAHVDPVARLLATLPAEFSRWSPLAQDQYLEVRTLLSGYLLSSQGDRMLMAHSVEGRFPFLDPEVVGVADRLPAAFKLRGLDEKHVLKRAAEGLVPESVLRRPKQPYRAPDALSFAGDEAPGWAFDVLGEHAVREAGVFDPGAVARLWRKVGAARGEQFSNADNMAVVGVLSTGLLHEALVRRAPVRGVPGTFRTVVDRLLPAATTNPPDQAEARIAT